MIAALLVVANLLLPQQAPPNDSLLEAQTRAVAAKLRCPTCQGLSIADSPAAQDMRNVIREQLKAGKTPKEVEAYFVEKFGDWILLAPPARGFNLAVYILPLIMLLGGAALVVHLARKWSRTPRATEEEELEPELR